MLNKLTFSLVVFLFAMLSAFVPTAKACTCIVTSSGIQPCQEYWRAGAVFSGRVNDISTTVRDQGDGRSGYRQKLVRFTVLEAFRGVEGNTVEVVTGMGGSDCGYDFREGESYFVYAYRNSKDHKLNTGICGRTMSLSKAHSDVEYARAIARGELRGIIFGVVLRYTRPDYQDFGKYKGMEQIPVTIEGNDRRFNLSTDNEGKFQLPGLPAGTYKVKAELPANLRTLPAVQEVKVDGKNCAAAEFVTSSLGTIQGKLLDAEGKPISDITLNLIPAEADGKEKSLEMREISSDTDTQGNYSFNGIPPGKYVIVVNYKGQPGQSDPPFGAHILSGNS